jgi:hypothetical protein
MKTQDINSETEELIKSLPLHLPAYRKIAAASHVFEDAPLYSFSDISHLIGVSRVGVRQRAIIDRWPTVEIWMHQGKTRRPQYVSGAFLATLQEIARANAAQAPENAPDSPTRPVSKRGNRKGAARA